MAKDLPSFIAQEGAKREGAVIREKNFIDANNYETVAYLKHLDVRNEPKMVLFENVPALNGQKSSTIAPRRCVIAVISITGTSIFGWA